jgi:seryl-tRNA synthetase
MLDLALIRAEPARVEAALARRGISGEAVAAVQALDAEWAARRETRESLRVRRRRASEEVARLKAAGADSSDLEDLGRSVSDQLARVEAEVADLDRRRLESLLALPNLPATDVPAAEPAAVETPPPWPKPFAPLAHWDLLEMLRLAAPADPPGPGRGFLVWRGRGARLVRALVDFMLDLHTGEHGCEEVRAPAVTTRAALTASAHLPLLEGKMFALAETTAPEPATSEPAADLSAVACRAKAEAAGHPAAPGPRDRNLFLAPRAEPHLANLYAGRTLAATDLPIRLVAAGPALRREASAGGKAGRGLLRLHEFDTVELYTFTRPESDAEELDRAVAAAETVLVRLQVPHRRRLRPATRLSHAAAKTVDLDVWAPGVGKWLTVAAISSFTDYQARRTETRFRDERGRMRLVHTIGGAAVALPHLIAAMLENGQEADGSVRLPAALAPYMGGEVLLIVSAGECH